MENKDMLDGFGEKGRHNEMIWKAKETKLCLSSVGSLPKKIWTHKPFNSTLRSPKKRIPRHNFSPVGPSKFLIVVAVVSPIYWWAKKYHNIKNKCNPFTKQWAINNNQVVFLYCICTVYTQRVKFVVYMYTKQLAVLFQTGFLAEPTTGIRARILQIPEKATT